MATYSIDENNDGYRDGTGIPTVDPLLIAESQQAVFDAIVELFTLDLTKIGGSMFHFVSGVAYDGTYIKFGGVEFYPLVFESDGWEVTTDGAPPRPKIRLSRVNSALFNFISNADDLVNCAVVRTKTFRKYLDDGATPNPNVYFPRDYYKIERKTSANKIFIEFELSSALDSCERKIPGRRILKNFCTHLYRRYDTILSAFDYTDATCPYTGDHYFNTYGQSDETIGPEDDSCGKQLSDCKARFSIEAAPAVIDFVQATEPTIFTIDQYWQNTFYLPARLYQAKGSFYSVYYKGSGSSPPDKDTAYFPYGEGDYWVDPINHRLWRYETPYTTADYNWYEKTVIASATQPTNVQDNQYWHDTTNNLWYAYDLKFYIAGYNELPYRGFPGAGGLEDL